MEAWAFDITFTENTISDFPRNTWHKLNQKRPDITGGRFEETETRKNKLKQCVSGVQMTGPWIFQSISRWQHQPVAPSHYRPITTSWDGENGEESRKKGFQSLLFEWINLNTKCFPSGNTAAWSVEAKVSKKQQGRHHLRFSCRHFHLVITWLMPLSPIPSPSLRHTQN